MDNHDRNTRKQDENCNHVDAEYDEIHGEKNYRELYYGFSEKGKEEGKIFYLEFFIICCHCCFNLHNFIIS